MISISYLFEAISAVDDRMNYSNERISTLQRAFKAGNRTLQQPPCIKLIREDQKG